ncbi:MAG: hypothetical protein HGB05_14390 [Chloroflexi bacterium]|nr:hypothetical protein [Chloroflexota bacterium]
MSELTTKQITVKLDDIAHLFVAPEFDPFSDQEAELLGQPALAYVLRQLGPATVRKKYPLRLTVQLPPDKITPDLKARAEQALDRFCTAHIADREAQLRVLRWNGWRSLPAAIIALGICLALSYLFLSNVLTFLSPVVNELLGQGFGIVSWVVLWHPVEAFLYDPIPLRREISALRYISALEMVVEPWRSSNG